MNEFLLQTKNYRRTEWSILQRCTTRTWNPDDLWKLNGTRHNFKVSYQHYKGNLYYAKNSCTEFNTNRVTIFQPIGRIQPFLRPFIWTIFEISVNLKGKMGARVGLGVQIVIFVTWKVTKVVRTSWKTKIARNLPPDPPLLMWLLSQPHFSALPTIICLPSWLILLN